MNFFRYKIVYYNEIEDKSITVYGITFGENYTEAMKNIEESYGDTLESVDCLEMITDISTYEITPEMFSDLESQF